MVFCDTHIHLLASEWQASPATQITAAQQAGIRFLIQPGVRVSDWDELVALAVRNSGVYAAPGLHPMGADSWNDAVGEQLRELCRLPQVVAIGEIGLDGLLEVDLAAQERVFRAQLAIALEYHLPVLIHCRQQTACVLSILADVDIQRVGGIWHGFSGSLETARQIVALGLKLGIGPILLRGNARKLPEALPQLLAESLVLETDAPDMASGPEVLSEVAQRLAELRGWTLTECARITTENARQLLKRIRNESRE